MESKSLCLATRNRHKVAELAAKLPSSWEVKSVADYPGLPEVEETGATFRANASLKARGVSCLVPGYVLADDSGLEVKVLDGAPGVYSARYAGLPSDDLKNNEKLLAELASRNFLKPQERAARFVCALVLARGGELLCDFVGTCEGMILHEPRGKQGFGYDPLFMPTGYDRTLAELGSDIKNQISHRAKAVDQFIEWSRTLPE
jgi:XTP/dITP diphosphohydrolase